ncbi:unnamed protein product [Diamesa tonsa]
MTQSKAEQPILERRLRLIKYILVAVILLCSAYAIAIFDPFEMILQDQLSIRKGSFLYSLWEKPPLDVFISIYIFNITNAQEFMSGKDTKLKVEQIGPYVYQEFLVNENATFHENGTLSFVPVRRNIYSPDRTKGDPMKDVVTVLNLPLLGISSAMTDISTIGSLAISTLAKSVNAQPILNLTVHDYLWGYDDPLVRLASNIAPTIINFERFGLLDRLFDEGHNIVSMNLPDKHSFSPELRDYSIDTWNGSPGLRAWGYEDLATEGNIECNTLRGCYDGTLFPKSIKKNETFKVYRKAFCRTLPIKYTHSGEHNGIEAYWFSLADNAFDDSEVDPASMCYCNKGKKCMKRGLGNITPCYYNIPVAVSLPHFYNSDPSLLNEVEGLSPNKSLHESIIILQPKLGTPMEVYSRIQLNLMMGETQFNSKIKVFENRVFPVLWVQIAIEKLTPRLKLWVFLLFNFFPPMQTFIVYLLGICGVSLFAGVVLIYCFFKHSPIDSTTIKYDSKRSIKYTAMFPYIKREIAKFDDKEKESLQRIDSV